MRTDLTDALLRRKGILRERITYLNNAAIQNGTYVLYWMQASQRIADNHALQYAILQANALGKPLVVCFGLTPDYPHATFRHYAFMLEGMRELPAALQRKGIAFVLRLGTPPKVAVELSKDACLAVTDAGYTQIQCLWRQEAASRMHCPLHQVETDVVVPVEQASVKEEYAARTIRPRILRQIETWLVPLASTKVHHDATALPLVSESLDNIDALLQSLSCDTTVPRSEALSAGERAAKKRLRYFLDRILPDYETLRNDPTQDGTSALSTYLHFGQISPLRIALDVDARTGHPAAEAFLEQLIVRRELAINFTYYNPAYATYESAVPTWAQATLRKHAADTREALYAYDQFESAQTHDPYWNAAQKQLRATGRIHNYMRMYWGKKLVEWAPTPEDGFGYALRLNDRWALDGRDPNGYTGVAWCFGRHDRPWPERPVFGTIRSMNAAGLRRKFDADLYVRQMENA